MMLVRTFRARPFSIMYREMLKLFDILISTIKNLHLVPMVSSTVFTSVPVSLDQTSL